eukprot:4048317-Prymnesium_polylepis.1
MLQSHGHTRGKGEERPAPPARPRRCHAPTSTEGPLCPPPHPDSNYRAAHKLGMDLGRPLEFLRGWWSCRCSSFGTRRGIR